jgi:hypothetical protein
VAPRQGLQWGRVDGWLPLPPQEPAVDDRDAGPPASLDSDSASSGLATNGDNVGNLDGDQPYCLQLGQFLVTVMRQRTFTLRARFGQDDTRQNGRNGVPFHTPGQRPDG